MSFLQVKAADWVSLPKRRNQLTAQRHAKTLMKLTVNVSAPDNLSMESDSQANLCNHTEVLPATTKLKRKAKFIETNEKNTYVRA